MLSIDKDVKSEGRKLANGFFSGIVWGGVVSAAVVGGVSLIGELPGKNGPSASSLEVPAGSQFDQSRDDKAANISQSGSTGLGQKDTNAPRVAEPVVDDIAVLSRDVTQSAAVPQTGNADAMMAAPSSGTDVDINVGGDAPIVSSSQPQSPLAPVEDSELSISTDPSQPVAPSLSTIEESTAFGEQPKTTAPENDTMASSDDDAAMETTPAMQPESANATPQAAPSVQSTEPQQPIAEIVTPVVPKTSIIASVAKSAVAAKPFSNLAPNVATNRLGRQSTPDPVTESGAEENQSAEDLEKLPPIERFATPFENTDQKPLMAIVLLDDGSSKIGLDALAAFPYPISFAVDTAWDGAADAMISYRAAGFEVLAMVDMIKGATPSDAETAMAVHLNLISEAVAVMEGVKTGFQGNRQATDQVTDILLESGHGWVLFPKGLNTVQKLATKAGIPATTVFRDFDSKGQKASAIRRFLDHAAFKAGQQKSGVVMVGRLRADTISALLLWGLQDRASSVALAPISAVLTNK